MLHGGAGDGAKVNHEEIKDRRSSSLAQWAGVRKALKEIVVDPRATPGERLNAIEQLKAIRKADADNQVIKMALRKANPKKKRAYRPRAKRADVSALLARIEKL